MMNSLLSYAKSRFVFLPCEPIQIAKALSPRLLVARRLAYKHWGFDRDAEQSAWQAVAPAVFNAHRAANAKLWAADAAQGREALAEVEALERWKPQGMIAPSMPVHRSCRQLAEIACSSSHGWS